MNAASAMYTLTRPQSPRWYGRLIAELVMTIAEQEIRLVDVDADLEQHTLRLTVVTDHLIVTSDIGDTNQDDTRPRTIARPRRPLRAVELGTQLGVFERAAFEDWPGQLTLHLTYPDYEVRLPGNATRGEEIEALTALVPSLLTDLSSQPGTP